MQALISRNIKLYFRDKAGVFYSLLSVLIIIALFALFLGDGLISAFDGVEGGEFYANSWVMAGILAVVSVTTTLGAFSSMIDDKGRKIIKDFNASPIKRWEIAGGYILSTCIVGIIMSLITLVAAQIYIKSTGGELLAAYQLGYVLLVILVSVLSGSAMMFFIATFIKTQNVFVAISTVVGTLIGFLTGIYVPISQLPEGVQSVIKVFPTSHSALLFRQIFTQTPSKQVFLDAPSSVVDTVEQGLGVQFVIDGITITPGISLIYLIACAVVFYALGLFIMSRKSK